MAHNLKQRGGWVRTDPPSKEPHLNDANSITPPTIANDPTWRRNLFLVVALSMCVFAHCLANGVVWDDHVLIGGSGIGGGESLLKCFTRPFLDHFFRPLVSVWFFFERQVWDWRSAGYHGSGLVLHGLATGVVACLMRRVFQSGRVAIWSAAAFAVHPIQVGSVAWTGGRTDTLVVLWAGLFLLNLVKLVQEPNRRPLRYFLLASFFALSVFTKEQTLALLVAGPLTVRLLGNRETPEQASASKRMAWNTLCLTALVAAAFIALGIKLGMPRPNASLLDTGQYLMQILWIGAYYLLLVIAPMPQWMFQTSIHPVADLGAAALILGGIAWVGSLASLAMAWRRNPQLAWCLAIGLLPLLPVSGILPLPFLLVASYRACLATLGLCGVAGYFLGDWLPRRFSASSPRQAVQALLLAGWVGLSAWGTTVWRTQSGFFQTSARLDPKSVVMHHLLGYDYSQKRDWAQSAASYEKVMDLLFLSRDWDDPAKGALAYQGDRKLQRRVIQGQGIDQDPRIWLVNTFTKLGSARFQNQDAAGAERAYTVGLSLLPDNEDALYGVGFAAYQRGDWQAAADFLGRAARKMPKHADLLAYYGTALSNLGRWEEAIDPWKRVVEMFPNLIENHLGLARAQLYSGKDFAAITTLTQANSKFPDDPRILGLMQEAVQRSQKR